MSLYEGMFLIDNRQANRDWEGALATLTGILTKRGGNVLRSVKWGEHKLAYEVNGRRRGTYVLIYFEAEGEAVTNIYRDCELSELVQRTLILKIKAVPPEDGMYIQSELGNRSRMRKPMGSRRPRYGAEDDRGADVEEEVAVADSDAADEASGDDKGDDDKS